MSTYMHTRAHTHARTHNLRESKCPQIEIKIKKKSKVEGQIIAHIDMIHFVQILVIVSFFVRSRPEKIIPLYEGNVAVM